MDKKQDKSTKPEEKASPGLKKLGVAPPVTPPPASGKQSTSQSRPPGRRLGGTDKAALEAMGVKFRKQDDDTQAEPAAKPKQAKEKAAPAKKRPPPPIEKGDEKKNRQEQASSVQNDLVITTTESGVQTLSVDVRKEVMPLNFTAPPTALTHVSFGIWCFLVLVVVVLWVIKLVTL